MTALFALSALQERRMRAVDPGFEELSRTYGKWNYVFPLAVLVSATVTGGVVYLLLHLLMLAAATTRHASADANTFVFFSDGLLLFWPAFFPALALAQYPAEWAMERILGDAYPGYARYRSLRWKRDRRRETRVVLRVTALVSLAMTIVLLRSHVIASPDELRITPMFGPERSYRYTDVADIRAAPVVRDSANHTEERRRMYVIRFRDGTTLNANYLLDTELEGRSARDLVRLVSRRSGIPITHFEALGEAELD